MRKNQMDNEKQMLDKLSKSEKLLFLKMDQISTTMTQERQEAKSVSAKFTTDIETINRSFLSS